MFGDANTLAGCPFLKVQMLRQREETLGTLGGFFLATGCPTSRLLSDLQTGVQLRFSVNRFLSVFPVRLGLPT